MIQSIVTSSLLETIPGLRHGFGTVAEPFPLSIKPDWDRAAPLWHQVHGVATAEVIKGYADHGNVDGLFTFSPLPVAVVTADCVPILLARKDGGAVAAIHSGWRGTAAHILRVIWDQLKSRGEFPQDSAAAIGPAIGPCCYEVSEDLADEFARDFDEAGPDIAVPKKRMLDLPAINAYELRAVGMQDIDLIRACTKCSMIGGIPKFHSYRREGSGTRQFSAIVGHE